MGFVGNYAPCGLSPQTNGMPVIPKKGLKFSLQAPSYFGNYNDNTAHFEKQDTLVHPRSFYFLVRWTDESCSLLILKVLKIINIVNNV